MTSSRSLKTALPRSRSPLNCRAFLIGGDHVLPAGLRGGEDLDGARPDSGGRVCLEQFEPGGVDVGTADGARLDGVEKGVDPGRPGEEGLGRRRASLGLIPGHARSRIEAARVSSKRASVSMAAVCTSGG